MQSLKDMKARETLLLTVCLYALQGMDGENIRFDSNLNMQIEYHNEAQLKPELVVESKLGSGFENALRACGEAGKYYRIIQRYIESVEAASESGFVARAFSRALALELSAYLDFVASTEAQVRAKDSTVTLRQLMIRLYSPTTRLRTMAILTDGLSTLRGGNLLYGIYKHSRHGDTRHAGLVRTMLRAASVPWFDTLYVWTTQGILMDPHDEFFVAKRQDIDPRRLWTESCYVVPERVPNGIIHRELVQPCLIVGKGINFIRKCLLDPEWKLDWSKITKDALATTETDLKRQLGYYCEVDQGAARKLTLHSTLVGAQRLVNSFIVESLLVKHKLLEHLWALKQFLLLGQGDFFSVLMEGLYAQFGAGQIIHRHSARSVIDGAVKSTNAVQLPAHVLDRLDVELLYDEDDDARFQFAVPKGGQSEARKSVWELFMLTYAVPDPVAPIVHSDALEQYKLVFSLLFSLKRIEFLLNMTWRQSTTLHHALQTFAQYNAIKVSTSEAYGKSITLLRHICMIRQSMMHFVVNLKSYLFFEVLEGAWKTLKMQIDSAKSLDDIIKAHNFYLSNITRNSLLPEGNDLGEAPSTSGTELQSLLALVLRFCEFQDTTFSEAIAAAERATEKRREAERRSRAGEWGFSSEEELDETQSFFGLTEESKMAQVVKMAEEFKLSTTNFLDGLLQMVNGSVSTDIVAVESGSHTTGGDTNVNHDFLQFLTFQLDYSRFYDVQKI